MLTPSKLDVQMLREEPPYSVMLKWQPTTLPSALSEAEFEQNLTITLYKVVMGFDNQFVEREITPENTKLEIWKTPVMVWWNLTDENIYTFTVCRFL